MLVAKLADGQNKSLVFAQAVVPKGPIQWACRCRNLSNKIAENVFRILGFQGLDDEVESSWEALAECLFDAWKPLRKSHLLSVTRDRTAVNAARSPSVG